MIDPNDIIKEQVVNFLKTLNRRVNGVGSGQDTDSAVLDFIVNHPPPALDSNNDCANPRDLRAIFAAQAAAEYTAMVRNGNRRLTLTPRALLTAPEIALCVDVTFYLLENRSGILTHGLINMGNQTFLGGVTILFTKAESTENATGVLITI